MNSTRNDGRPTPDPDNYRLMVILTWLAAFIVEIFGTAVLVGIHQTDEDRAGYWPSWPWCCVLGGTAVGPSTMPGVPEPRKDVLPMQRLSAAETPSAASTAL